MARSPVCTKGFHGIPGMILFFAAEAGGLLAGGIETGMV